MLCEQTPVILDLPIVSNCSHLAEVKEFYHQRKERDVESMILTMCQPFVLVQKAASQYDVCAHAGQK